MNSTKLLNELRDLYREGKFEDLKRKYYLGGWMLSPEHREKIERVMGLNTEVKKEPETIPITQIEKEHQQQLIDFALKEMGGKIIE